MRTATLSIFKFTRNSPMSASMRSFCGIAIVLIAHAAFAVETKPLTMSSDKPSFEPKPGVTKAIPCIDAPDQSMDLYLPPQYFKDTERKFPVLFLSSPNAKPNISQHIKWADRQGVILITINNSQNGPWPPIFKAQDAVWRTAEANLRLHPCLRFANGMSGAACASHVLASYHAEQFAGTLMEGQCCTGDKLPKYICVAFINGDKDPNAAYIETSERHLRGQGNPVQHFVKPGGHVPGTTEEEEKYLDWMLDFQRFNHPKLSAEDKARNKAHVLEQMDSAEKLESPTARFELLDKMLSIADFAKLPESKAHISACVKAAADASGALTDKKEKYAILSRVAFKDYKNLADSASKSAFEKELGEARRDPEVKTEWDADTAYAQVAVAERQAGDNKAAVANVCNLYAQIQQHWPNTAAGKKALDDTNRLKPGKTTATSLGGAVRPRPDSNSSR